MARAIDQSTKQSYTLIQFTVNGTPYRFTNWGTSIDPAGENWLSVPSLEVKWPNNVGTLNDAAATVRAMEDSSATMQALVDLLLENGAPAPEVGVLIKEVITSTTGGVEATTLVPYQGYVHRAVRNAEGRSKMVKFECVTQKSLLEVNLGLPCGHHCIFALFGKGCSVQGGAGQRGPQRADEIREDLAIIAISGKTIQLDEDPNIDAPKSLQYGYVERDGVSIGIQNWDPLEPTVVLLRQEPPPSWLGNFVTVVPGCAKNADVCDDHWDNLENFGGIGYAIPAYNPAFEDSP